MSVLSGISNIQGAMLEHVLGSAMEGTTLQIEDLKFICIFRLTRYRSKGFPVLTSEIHITALQSVETLMSLNL